MAKHIQITSLALAQGILEIAPGVRVWERVNHTTGERCYVASVNGWKSFHESLGAAIVDAIDRANDASQP